MAPPRRRPAQKKATFSSPAAMAQAQRGAESKSMKALQDRREQTRKDFFKGREDISPSRLDRRQIQADLYDKFKQGLTIAPGTTNLYQEQAPVFNPMTGRYERTTLADKAQELAFKYGPTPREVLGDIGYGIRSIGAGLGEKISQGRFGILGIAKDLYEKFTNSATKAKDALVKGVEKLSDIDLEILKNKGQYKFTSKKPEIQEVEDLQKTQMTEFDKANIIRQGIEQLETAPVSTTGTLGFKVMPTSYFPGQFGATPVPNNIQQAQNPNELRRALMENTMPNNFPQEKPYLMQQDDYYYQDKERFSPQGNQYLYADASQQDIDRINKMRQLKSMDPQSIYDMRDVFQLSPELTLEDIQGIKEGTITQPTGVFAAEGGMIDKRLDNIQKKTNNIYGTGILSVR